MRIAAQTVAELVLTVLLMWLLAGALMSIENPNPGEALLDDAPRLVFGAFWIGLILWVVLVVVGNVVHRNRGPAARVTHNLLSALVAAIVNVGVLIVIGITAGGAGIFLAGIALMAGLAFLVAAVIGVFLTHLVLFRPRYSAPVSAGTTPTASATP